MPLTVAYLAVVSVDDSCLPVSSMTSSAVINEI